MATKIEQITKGDDNIYPVTKSEAVYMDDGNTLQSFADSTLTAEESIPIEPLTPTVSTDMIIDGAVTNNKIDDGAVTDSKIGWNTITDVLYNGPSATSGTVYFSKQVTDYDIITIQFYRKAGNSNVNSVSILNPANGKPVSLTVSVPNDNNTMSFYAARGTLNTSSFSFNAGCAVAFSASGLVGFGAGNELCIEKVIGVKLH